MPFHYRNLFRNLFLVSTAVTVSAGTLCRIAACWVPFQSRNPIRNLMLVSITGTFSAGTICGTWGVFFHTGTFLGLWGMLKLQEPFQELRKLRCVSTTAVCFLRNLRNVYFSLTLVSKMWHYYSINVLKYITLCCGTPLNTYINVNMQQEPDRLWKLLTKMQCCVPVLLTFFLLSHETEIYLRFSD